MVGIGNGGGRGGVAADGGGFSDIFGFRGSALIKFESISRTGKLNRIEANCW